MKNFLNTHRKPTFVFLVICLVLAIYGVMFFNARRRLQIRRATTEYVVRSGGTVSVSASRIPLLGVLGIDETTGVILAGVDSANLDFSRLLSFKYLDTVQLNHATHVDVAMPALAKLPNLKMLILSGSDVTNDGLLHFAGHAGMVSIDLQRSTIDREMMQTLASMPNLEYLILNGAQFNPENLKAFSSHNSLQVLIAPDTSVSDDDVKTLLSIPKLKVIRVGADQLTPQAVQELLLKMRVSIDG